MVTSAPRLAVCPVRLLAEMGLYLLPEDQHPQVRVGGLAHGLGLDAHAVLLRRQRVGAALLVPEVEEARDRAPDHHQVTVQVFSIKVDVFSTPAFHFHVKSTNGQKI